MVLMMLMQSILARFEKRLMMRMWPTSFLKLVRLMQVAEELSHILWQNMGWMLLTAV